MAWSYSRAWRGVNAGDRVLLTDIRRKPRGFAIVREKIDDPLQTLILIIDDTGATKTINRSWRSLHFYPAPLDQNN